MKILLILLSVLTLCSTAHAEDFSVNVRVDDAYQEINWQLDGTIFTGVSATTGEDNFSSFSGSFVYDRKFGIAHSAFIEVDGLPFTFTSWFPGAPASGGTPRRLDSIYVRLTDDILGIIQWQQFGIHVPYQGLAQPGTWDLTFTTGEAYAAIYTPFVIPGQPITVTFDRSVSGTLRSDLSAPEDYIQFFQEERMRTAKEVKDEYLERAQIAKFITDIIPSKFDENLADLGLIDNREIDLTPHLKRTFSSLLDAYLLDEDEFTWAQLKGLGKGIAVNAFKAFAEPVLLADIDAAAYAKFLSSMAIVVDPPDSNYLEIVQPSGDKLSFGFAEAFDNDYTGLDEDLVALGTGLDEAFTAFGLGIENEERFRLTLERLQGAMLAGSAQGIALQSASASSIFGELESDIHGGVQPVLVVSQSVWSEQPGP